MTAILLALLQAGIVPEIMSFVRDHFTATGKMPTDAQVLERVTVLATAIVTKGEDYLATHPREDPPPVG